MNFLNALHKLVIEHPNGAIIRKDPATNKPISTFGCSRGFYLKIPIYANTNTEALVETFPRDFSAADYLADDFELE
jgi:S-ribosylhomocysteine lyase LuxS involved in autoinducer biosynthesis